MGDEVLSPPFSFVYCPAFTYLCIISHHCNASESNFKENLGIQNILIHQKSSNLANSLILTYATSVEVWDNMASLQWWFHLQRSDWSEISEWLTCRNCELLQTSFRIFFYQSMINNTETSVSLDLKSQSSNGNY